VIFMKIQFPGGRYHATPWQHHVNEGVPEWPPSPWRILRALVSTMHNRPEIDRRLAGAVIRKLSSPPSFTLPRAGIGHTRHYMSQNAVDRSKTALVLDTFVSVHPEDCLWVHWPADLSRDEERCLDQMLRSCSYLGRAESWVEMALVHGGGAPAPDCTISDGRPSFDHTTERVLGCSGDFTLGDLERTTAILQDEGWSDPPGSRWLFYRRRADCFASEPKPREPSEEQHQVAELLLGGSVLPLFTDAVQVAERVRQAALACHRDPSETLSGKDADGRPLKEQHRHAHFLPDSQPEATGRLRDRGRVTHVYIYAPRRFTPSEMDAISRITYLRWEDSSSDLDVVLGGFGDPQRFAERSRLFQAGTRWVSRTPFVFPRHVKNNRDSPTSQVERELSTRAKFLNGAQPIDGGITRLDRPDPGATAELKVGFNRWSDFRIKRRYDRQPPGFGGFEITFDRAVSGPLLLGYGCHYGLGQFVPRR
jgi:CRISPR-associated protein Csb2